MKPKLRVLWMSDSPTLATGFGRVTREITHRLAKHPALDVACVACGYLGQSSHHAAQPVRLYPAANRTWGRDAIETAVNDFKPHLLVSLGELRTVEWLARHRIRSRFKWVGYIPLDGGPFYPPWESVLSEMQE